MIQRLVTLKWPWTMASLVQTERFLSEVSRSATKYRVGVYTGNGVAGLALTLGMKADAVLIMPNTIGGSTPTAAAIALRLSPNVTYCIGVGTLSDAVTSWTDTGVVLGLHASVNQAGQTYHYLALG